MKASKHTTNRQIDIIDLLGACRNELRDSADSKTPNVIVQSDAEGVDIRVRVNHSLDQSDVDHQQRLSVPTTVKIVDALLEAVMSKLLDSPDNIRLVAEDGSFSEDAKARMRMLYAERE